MPVLSCFTEECFYNDVRRTRKFTVYVFHHVFLQVLILQSWKLAQRGLLKRSKKKLYITYLHTYLIEPYLFIVVRVRRQNSKHKQINCVESNEL